MLAELPLSTTFTRNVYVPAVVSAPLRLPLAESVNPGGMVEGELTSDQVTPVPQHEFVEAVRLLLKLEPTVKVPRKSWEFTFSGEKLPDSAKMVKKFWDVNVLGVPLAESVNCQKVLKPPFSCGVPLTTKLFEFSVSPA